jgi:restriction endonuclease S subunit
MTLPIRTAEPLPKGWASAVLEDYINIAGRIGWRGLKKEEYLSEGIPFLAVKDILENGSINFDVTDFLSVFRYEESPEIQLKNNDVLVTKDGTIGKIGFVENLPSKVTVNSSILVVRPCQAILPRFLFYYFKGPKFQKLVREKIAGTAVPHLFQHDIKKFEVHIPPFNEQRRIVGKVEELFSFLDAARESLRRVQAQLKRYRQAVLKYAFEGKHSANWAVCRLESCSNLITKGESPNWQGFYYVDDGIFFIRSENVLWGSVRLDNIVKVPQEFHVKLKRSQLKADDVLVNLVGASIGRCGIVPSFVETANINQAVALIRVNDFLLPEFLMHFLLSPRMQKEIQQNKVETARPNISLQNLRDLKIPLPSIDEQKKVVVLINQTLAKLDNTSDYVKMSLQLSERLRQAVLKKAFEGQLVPQDPNDEPAERLLERIKADRLSNKSKNNNQLELSQYVK